jgi:hypothetical protein
VVKDGSALIEGNLTVSPHAVLAAAFAGSNLTVEGDLKVQRDATLILGCAPSPEFPCLDDEKGLGQGSVSGNLSSQQPLGVVVHNSTIGGNVQETGGGGGFTCKNLGPKVERFHVFGGGVFGEFPVFSSYSDSTINGNLSVIDLTSCYLEMSRVHVGRSDQGREQDGNRGEQDGNGGEQHGNGGNVDLIDNQLADPDAIEILSNQISGNLVCRDNSKVWDSHELEPKKPGIFPRGLDRNEVSGDRVGQCVLAGPLEKEGGPLAGGPF